MPAELWIAAQLPEDQVSLSYPRAGLQTIENQIESLLFSLGHVHIPHGMNQRLVKTCQRQLRMRHQLSWQQELLSRLRKFYR